MGARDEADAAAAAADVTVERADVPELISFLESVWGEGRVGDPSLIAAIAHAGNSVLFARRGGRAVGAALGVLGWSGGVHLHSHMVAAMASGGGVGYAIKLAQRADCLDHGVTEMRWTFDPLIRRNAHVNLVKLGATVVAFHPNFYGSLDDAINGSDTTDRFEVSWRLDAPVGAPVHPGPTDFVLPADYEALRREDAASARALRDAGTAAFGAATRWRFTGVGYRLSAP